MADNGLQWHFDRLGNISDGLGHSVKFENIVKSENGTVTDINGNPLALSITSAAKLGNILPEEVMLKSDVTPNINTKNLVIGTKFSTTDKVNSVTTAVVNFTGQETSIAIGTIGSELLPNTTFVNSTNVNSGNDAILTTANNELRVKPNTTGNPFGVMDFTMVAGKYYKLFVELAGIHPSIDIIDPSSNTVLEKTSDSRVSVILAPTVTGTYKIRFFMYYSANDLNASMIASFKYPTIKEIDKETIPQNMLITLNKISLGGEIIKNTEIRTNIPSFDVNYNATKSYSNLEGNNLAFFYNSFTLMQYIDTVSGKPGFIKAGDGTIKQYLVNTNNEYVGNFASMPVGGADLFNLVGNTTREFANGVLKIKRTDINNDTEMYVDTTCGIGKNMYVSFYLEDIVGNWSFKFGEKELNLLKHTKMELNAPNASTLITTNKKGVKQKVEFVITTTTNINKFRLINLAGLGAVNDYISIRDINIYEMDSSVWKNVTPVDNNSYSSVYEHPSSEILILSYPNTADVTNGDYRFKPKNICTLFGKNTFIMDGIVYYMDDSVSWDDKDIIINSSRSKLFNDKNCLYTIKQTSYNNLFMYKDNLGMLSLIANDVINGTSCVIAQTATIPGQELDLGLTNNPDIVTITALNNYSLLTHYDMRPTEELVSSIPELTFFKSNDNLKSFDYVTNMFKSLPVTRAVRIRPALSNNKLILGHYHKDFSKNNVVYVKAETSNNVVKTIRYLGRNESQIFDLDNKINFGVIKDSDITATLDRSNKTYILDATLGSDIVKETTNNDTNASYQIGVNVFNLENSNFVLTEYNAIESNLILNKTDMVYFGYFICTNANGCVKTFRNKLNTKLTSDNSLFVYNLGITDKGTDTVIESITSTTIESYINQDLLK